MEALFKRRTTQRGFGEPIGLVGAIINTNGRLTIRLAYEHKQERYVEIEGDFILLRPEGTTSQEGTTWRAFRET